MGLALPTLPLGPRASGSLFKQSVPQVFAAAIPHFSSADSEFPLGAITRILPLCIPLPFASRSPFASRPFSVFPIAAISFPEISAARWPSAYHHSRSPGSIEPVPPNLSVYLGRFRLLVTFRIARRSHDMLKPFALPNRIFRSADSNLDSHSHDLLAWLGLRFVPPIQFVRSTP